MSDEDRDTQADAPPEDTGEVEPRFTSLDELDDAALERRHEALAQVHKWGDPVLRSIASPVADFDTSLAAESERMIALMRDALGVGLAATQLGALRRVIVYQSGPEEEPRALVNPEIEWSSEETEVAEEGCLSLPGIAVDVERALRVGVRAREIDGGELSFEASELEARVIQHEIDHLDGVLILDRTIPEQRRGAVTALREGGSFEPADLLPDEPDEEGGEVTAQGDAAGEPAKTPAS